MSTDGETRTFYAAAADTGSGRLEVRCPSCHEPTEVAVDTSLTDLTCSACGSHFSLVDQSKATRMAPSLSKMGRFELIERIGVGGFGSVWKARDKELDRTVAIKIPRQGGMTAEEQEKFFREARAAAQLRHPSIVSVHEVGRDGDSVYIVSDFVRGVTLGDWLTGQQLTSREAAELCVKIAEALHHAHEHGVVHRDLKPANIMIDGDGEPHLMDFGLARREAGEVTMTVDGQVLGTPAYMSPEQAQGEAHTADRRSDVYSLGVILFQLLTAELPFRGNARMLMHQVIHDDPPSPRNLNATIPKDLETITLKCLEKEPSKRYQTADDFSQECRRFLSGDPINARPTGRVSRAWRWAKRRPALAALILSLPSAAIIVAVVATIAAFRLDQERRQTTNSLYQSLVREARAIRLSRSPGYRERAWAILQQAARLDTPNLDVRELRDEAIGCMGDFAGLKPTTVRGFSSTVTALEVGNEPTFIAVGMHDGSIVIADATKPGSFRQIAKLTSPITRLEISDDESVLAAATSDGYVIRWKLQNREWEQLNSTKIGPHILALVCGRPTECFVVRKVGDSQLQVWDIENQKKIREVSAPGWLMRAAVTTSGNRLAAGCWEKEETLRIWDVATGRLITKTLPNLGGFKDIAFAGGSKEIACACGDGLIVVNAETGDVISKHKVTTYDRVAPAQNRRLAAFVAVDGRVRLWNFESGSELAQLQISDAHNHMDDMEDPSNDLMGFSLKDRWFAYSGKSAVYVWDLLRTPESISLDAHEGGVPGLAFSPDGKWLASVGKDRKCVVSNVVTGETQTVIGGDFVGPLQSVSYHPNGEVVAVGGWGDGATLWHLASGKRLRTYHVNDSQIWRTTFSDDGTLLAAVGGGGACIWRLELEDRLNQQSPSLSVDPLAKSDLGGLFCQFQPNGHDLFYSHSRNIMHLNPENGAVRKLPGIQISAAFDLQPFGFTPDGDYLVIFGQQTSQRYSMRKRRLISQEPLMSPVSDLRGSSEEGGRSLSQDGKKLAVIVGRTMVAVVNTDTSTPRRQFTLPGSPGKNSDIWYVDWAPNGRQLAVSCADGTLSVWNIDQVAKQLAEIGLPLD